MAKLTNSRKRIPLVETKDRDFSIGVGDWNGQWNRGTLAFFHRDVYGELVSTYWLHMSRAEMERIVKTLGEYLACNMETGPHPERK